MITKLLEKYITGFLNCKAVTDCLPAEVLKGTAGVSSLVPQIMESIEKEKDLGDIEAKVAGAADAITADPSLGLELQTSLDDVLSDKPTLSRLIAQMTSLYNSDVNDGFNDIVSDLQTGRISFDELIKDSNGMMSTLRSLMRSPVDEVNDKVSDVNDPKEILTLLSDEKTGVGGTIKKLRKVCAWLKSLNIGGEDA